MRPRNFDHDSDGGRRCGLGAAKRNARGRAVGKVSGEWEVAAGPSDGGWVFGQCLLFDPLGSTMYDDMCWDVALANTSKDAAQALIHSPFEFKP
jgi:hypothetical protein